MAKFLNSGKILINTDCIAAVEYADPSTLRITMKGGEVRHVPAEYYASIAGVDVIRQVVPVQGMYAMCGKPGWPHVYYPIHLLAVTAAGKVRPISLTDEYPTFLDRMPDYKGIDFDDRSRTAVRILEGNRWQED